MTPTDPLTPEDKRQAALAARGVITALRVHADEYDLDETERAALLAFTIGTLAESRL